MDFFADFTHSTFNQTEDRFEPRGVKIRASTFEDAVSQITIITTLSKDYSLERVSMKPTRGMEYRTLGEWHV